ncbi:glycoside hydrolase 43 family protein [Microbacterium yannicii]|uniref:Glycoside hydrolase 43 family protein n=1 Tax=Microbacterium yannicii TaxID=671622 RepID=A0ABP9LVG8_9MICO|nr:glycoside hydrolase 43 family protein [Microbacterium yannicii]MCO5953636.1 glycoside hydrolase 43 family protein [Microbacterium yannicii]
MDVRRAPTYRNPVIDADYSDPDAVRVGDEYWMIASSFNLAPGLPVLRSSDLVHWEHVANALPEVPPTGHFSLPRHGGGVWAPSLRHHDGRFVIVYPDPDHGIFVMTATDPRGPWSTPRALIDGRGLIDPCPLWADDGRAYLVHGWAKSRAGFKNRLTVVEVSADLTRVVGRPRVVIDGEDLDGFSTLEGPKLYQRDGWYWIFAPAGGVETGWQTVFRSRDPYGPYEHRIVLAQGDTEINGPHQGAWVDTPGGEHWFLHFQDRGPIGRVVHLQPMRWTDDGWPEMGMPGPDGVGQPVLRHPSPEGAVEDGPDRRLPYEDDDFTGSLAPSWTWQANPRAAWTAGPADGALRLAAVADDTGDLRLLGHVLSQRMPGQAAVISTTIEASALTGDASRAGLVLLGRDYAWVGVERAGGVVRAVMRASTEPGGAERALTAGVPIDGTLHVRVRTDGAEQAWLGWSTDGRTWIELADAVAFTPGRWIGTHVGLFAAAPLGDGSAGGVATFRPLRTVLDVEIDVEDTAQEAPAA